MSKAVDRVLDAIDVGFQQPADKHHGSQVNTDEGLCWRCLRNPSRHPGEDHTCEPCFAYLNEETDKDPRMSWGGSGHSLPPWWERGGIDDSSADSPPVRANIAPW